MKMRCWILTTIGALIFVCPSGIPAMAEEAYPSRPVTTIIPWPPGGGTDSAGRIFAEVIAKYLKQPFVVLNKPGASSTLGASALAKSKPDGYTLGHLGSTATLAECFTKYFTTDYTSEEFVPIAQWSGYPPVYFCEASKPFKSFKDLLQSAKNKGEVLFASRGRGEATSLILHVAMEKEGVKNIRFVPFKGDSEILSAVLGGHADFGVITFSMAPPLMAAGKIKPLAIATQDKIPAYPEIPNVYELGYHSGIRQFYLGMFAPKGTPATVIKILEKATEQVTLDSAFQNRMNNMNQPVIFKTSEQLSGIVQEMKKTYFDMAQKGLM
jgi:tripartite-type tricarboxylate transporter receptor subunit TctC